MSTAAEQIAHYCKRYEVMCTGANERGECNTTACWNKQLTGKSKNIDNNKVTLTFTIEEIKNLLLPLYESHIFDMIRDDPSIDNPGLLYGHMQLYGRLCGAIGCEMEENNYLK